MDWKDVKQAKWAFRFNQPLIKLWKIDPQTGEETFMGDDWIRGMWNAYTWYLDPSKKSWVAITVFEKKIQFWIKEVDLNIKIKKATHYKVFVANVEEQKIAIGEPDIMIREEGGAWKKKHSITHFKTNFLF